MTVHLGDAADLSQVDVFSVSKRNDLVKGAQQLERVPVNLTSVGRSAGRRDNSGDQLKSVDVYLKHHKV